MEAGERLRARRTAVYPALTMRSFQALRRMGRVPHVTSISVSPRYRRPTGAAAGSRVVQGYSLAAESPTSL